MRRALAVYAALLTAGWFIGHWVHGFAVPEMRPMNEPTIHRLVTTALILFVVAAAIPFVPGAEIGFALLLIFGAQAAPVVYVGMVGALVLSYSVARFVPVQALVRVLSWLGLHRASDVVEELSRLDPSHRWQYMVDRMPPPWLSKALRNRYLTLAVLLNTPGNSLIGGGGGIAFLSGLSRMLSFWSFLAVALIAVLPVPLAFVLIASL
ncbi:hypothetical protein EI983_06115 [Roseovarius faecimaris]|uniref:DedA family protein n=2 Tax=Roseovarius faecimaris TaxID=2494550 RepID=A0A6I6INN6_9RHOB|nr:hypothetical protein EI983_06115 [Roseovarius faecimaris]